MQLWYFVCVMIITTNRMLLLYFVQWDPRCDMSSASSTPAGKCGTYGTCKIFLLLPKFQLLSPVSSSPYPPQVHSWSFYLPWVPPENARFEDMGQSRVFPVPFSSRSVSLQEMESGGGWSLFLLCPRSWLVPPPSKVQWAFLSAFSPGRWVFDCLIVWVFECLLFECLFKDGTWQMHKCIHQWRAAFRYMKPS